MDRENDQYRLHEDDATFLSCFMDPEYAATEYSGSDSSRNEAVPPETHETAITSSQSIVPVHARNRDAMRRAFLAWVAHHRNERWAWRAGVMADGQYRYYAQTRALRSWRRSTEAAQLHRLQMAKAAIFASMAQYKRSIRKWRMWVKDRALMRHASTTICRVVTPQCSSRRALRILQTHASNRIAQRSN